MNSLLVGREIRPRVRRTPLGVVSNDAPDACYLARSYGLTPDEWQADVLADWLGRRADGRWAAPNCGLAVARQNGKNGVIEVRELFGMVVLGEKFLHTAHEVKTARKAFIRLCSFFENERQYPELAAMVKEIRRTNGQEAIVLHNGGSIEFIARSRGSGRGFTVDILVLDEAQDLTSEELAALLPTISASPLGNPQTILTGTPPVKKTGAKGEVFRGIRVEGEHGKSERLAWTDFGMADGPIPDIEDRALWYQTNPTLGDRLGLEQVESELELMAADPEGFARERLGWWGDPEAEDAGVIDLVEWSNLADRESPAPERVCMFLDVSPDRGRASIGLAGETGGRTMILVSTNPGTAWVVAEIQRLRERLEVAEIALQPTSQAGSLIPALVRAGIEFEAVTSAEMGRACSWTLQAIAEQTISHAAQPELDSAVQNARTRMRSEAEVWDRRDRSIDISPLVAGASAAFRCSLNVESYDVLASIG